MVDADDHRGERFDCINTGGVMEVDSATVSRDGTLMLFTGYPNSQEDIYMMTRSCAQ